MQAADSLRPAEQLLIVNTEDAEPVRLFGPLLRIEHGPHAGFDLLDRIGSMGKPVNDHRRFSRLDSQNLDCPQHSGRTSWLAIVDLTIAPSALPVLTYPDHR